jgi:hypothetical protein
MKTQSNGSQNAFPYFGRQRGILRVIVPTAKLSAGMGLHIRPNTPGRE